MHLIMVYCVRES